MNKKIAVLVLSVVLVLACVSAYADIYYTTGGENAGGELSYKNNPVNKFVRGVTNGVTSPIEIPESIAKVTADTNNLALGLTVGAAVGLANGFVRLASGVADVGTFIIPPYDKPLVQPEYVFQQKEGTGLMAQLRRVDDKLREILW